MHDNKPFKNSIAEFADRLLRFQKRGWGVEYCFPENILGSENEHLPKFLCSLFRHLLKELYKEGLLEIPTKDVSLSFDEEDEQFKLVFKFGK